jgi:hypothetical protein
MWGVLYVKSIQITLDEQLLARLDADSEVRRYGRSAVLRRAAEEYLCRGRKRAIASQYAKAYGAQPSDQPGFGAEFAGWEGEGSWPER